MLCRMCKYNVISAHRRGHVCSVCDALGYAWNSFHATVETSPKLKQSWFSKLWKRVTA